MKFSNPDKNQVLITLSKKEFSDRFEKIDLSDKKDILIAVKAILKNKAFKRIVPDLSGKFFLSFGELGNNYFILLQKRTLKPHKKQNEYLLVFNNFEDLELFVLNLSYKCSNSSLYKSKNNFYLICSTDTSADKIISFSSEFCGKAFRDSKKISAVKEYATLLCSDNAIEKIKLK